MKDLGFLDMKSWNQGNLLLGMKSSVQSLQILKDNMKGERAIQQKFSMIDGLEIIVAKLFEFSMIKP